MHTHIPPFTQTHSHMHTYTLGSEERQVTLRKNQDGFGMHLSAGPPPIFVEFVDKGWIPHTLTTKRLYIYIEDLVLDTSVMIILVHSTLED